MRFLSRDILALDWDHREVRAVAARASGKGLTVTRMFREPLAEGIASDDPASFGPWLGEVVRKNHCGGMKAIVALPRDQAVLKNLSIPPTPEYEIPHLVQFQMQRELPFPAEDAVIDYAVGEHLASEGTAADAGGAEGEKQIDLLVAATRREAIDYYRAVASNAGLTLARIGLRCFCNMETVRACVPDSENQRVLLVNVGPELTEIDILHGWQLLFSRSASVPLDGNGHGRSEEGAGSDPRAEFLRRLNLEVNRSVQAARATVSGLEVDRLVVAGPQEIARQIAERIGRELNLPAWVLEPGADIDLPAKHRSGAGLFSAAIGLALGQVDRSRTPFDFLHPHEPVDLAGRKKKRRLAIAGAVAGALVAALIGNQVALSAKGSHVDRREAKMKELKKLAGEVDHIAGAVADIRRETSAGPDWMEEYRRINQVITGERDLHRSAHLTKFNGILVGNEGGWKITVAVLAEAEAQANKLERRLRAEYEVEKRPAYSVTLKNPSGTRSGDYDFDVVVEFNPSAAKAKKK